MHIVSESHLALTLRGEALHYIGVVSCHGVSVRSDDAIVYMAFVAEFAAIGV